LFSEGIDFPDECTLSLAQELTSLSRAPRGTLSPAQRVAGQALEPPLWQRLLERQLATVEKMGKRGFNWEELLSQASKEEMRGTGEKYNW